MECIKTYAFIDSQNVNLGIQSQGWKIDFARFGILLKERYHVEKAFLFIGYIQENRQLYKYLRSAGYILIFKPTLEQKSINKPVIKGNVDAELVLHTMIQFDSYDKAIIVSGDGDFFCLIEFLVSKQKLLKVLVPNRKYSSLLRRFAQYIVQIDLFRQKVEKK